MAKKLPLILFFIASAAPTPEEELAATEITGCRVVFRNAKVINYDAGLEACDGVAGAVPASYEDLPSPEEAVETWQEELAAAVERRKVETAESSKRDAALLVAQAQKDVEAAKKACERAEKKLADKEAFLEKVTVQQTAQATTEPTQAAPVVPPAAPTPQPPAPAPAPVQQPQTGQAPVSPAPNAGWTSNT